MGMKARLIFISFIKELKVKQLKDPEADDTFVIQTELLYVGCYAAILYID